MIEVERMSRMRVHRYALASVLALVSACIDDVETICHKINHCDKIEGEIESCMDVWGTLRDSVWTQEAFEAIHTCYFDEKCSYVVKCCTREATNWHSTGTSQIVDTACARLFTCQTNISVSMDECRKEKTDDYVWYNLCRSDFIACVVSCLRDSSCTDLIKENPTSGKLPLVQTKSCRLKCGALQ